MVDKLNKESGSGFEDDKFSLYGLLKIESGRICLEHREKRFKLFFKVVDEGISKNMESMFNSEIGSIHYLGGFYGNCS